MYRNTIGRVFTWFGNKARDARRVSGSVFNAIGALIGVVIGYWVRRRSARSTSPETQIGPGARTPGPIDS